MSEAKALLQKGLSLWEVDRRGAEQCFVNVYRNFEGTNEADLAQAYLYKLRNGEPRSNPEQMVPNLDRHGLFGKEQLADEVSYEMPSAVRNLLWGSKIAFCVSLLLPAYTTYYGDHSGLEALLLGPIGLFAGHFSWLANPFLWFVWRTTRRGRFEFSFMSVIALFLAITFLFHEEIAVGSAGMYSYTAHVGYYLWLVSIGLALIGGFLGWREKDGTVRE